MVLLSFSGSDVRAKAGAAALLSVIGARQYVAVACTLRYCPAFAFGKSNSVLRIGHLHSCGKWNSRPSCLNDFIGRNYGSLIAVWLLGTCHRPVGPADVVLADLRRIYGRSTMKLLKRAWKWWCAMPVNEGHNQSAVCFVLYTEDAEGIYCGRTNYEITFPGIAQANRNQLGRRRSRGTLQTFGVLRQTGAK